MTNILAFDIGGANIKATFFITKNGVITDFRSSLEYFPFWKRTMEQLYHVLSMQRDTLIDGLNMPDVVGITLTAELSDVFKTKRDGVNQILDCVERTFTNIPIKVLDVDGNLLTVEEAKKEPIKVSSANWVATGWMIAQYIRNCVIVDVGSTTTSIIPVIDGKIVAKGKTDLEKLILGELVYSGSLRTNLAAIVQEVPVRGQMSRVSSELFAQSGDVHLILGNISEVDYTSETTDNKGKSCSEAEARLARLVCADIEILSKGELLDIAKYIYEKQILQIKSAIEQIFNELNFNAKTTLPIVVTGLGKDFLAKRAAEELGVLHILDITELLPNAVALISPSVGIALMVATNFEGRALKWMQ